LLKAIKGEKRRLIWKGIDSEKAKIQERIEKLIGLSDYLVIKLLSGVRIIDDGESVMALLMDSALIISIRDEVYSSLLERGLSVDDTMFETTWEKILYPVIKNDVREINSIVIELKKELKSWLRYRSLEHLISISIEPKQLHDLCLLWDMEDRFQSDELSVTQEEVLKEFGWGARYYYSLKETEKRLTEGEDLEQNNL